MVAGRRRGLPAEENAACSSTGAKVAKLSKSCGRRQKRISKNASKQVFRLRIQVVAKACQTMTDVLNVNDAAHSENGEVTLLTNQDGRRFGPERPE